MAGCPSWGGLAGAVGIVCEQLRVHGGPELHSHRVQGLSSSCRVQDLGPGSWRRRDAVRAAIGSWLEGVPCTEPWGPVPGPSAPRGFGTAS